MRVAALFRPHPALQELIGACHPATFVAFGTAMQSLTNATESISTATLERIRPRPAHGDAGCAEGPHCAWLEGAVRGAVSGLAAGMAIAVES